jgi:acetyl esterase/lipase
LPIRIFQSVCRPAVSTPKEPRVKAVSAKLARRGFLAALSVGCAGLAAGPTVLNAQQAADNANSAPPAGSAAWTSTHTYKRVGDLELKADVYRPDDDQRRPVLMWIHGGALIRGSRADVNRQIKQRFLDAGYAIVSIDYRLAPETKLPQIIEDLGDAYRWLHAEGPQRFDADTRRIAIAGDSAGGYLTLMAGFCLNPRPAALVALWGYGDITGAWYTQPNAFYRANFPLISPAEARAGIGGKPLVSRGFEDQRARSFYLYCRQQGLWTTSVSGFDPITQDRALTRYCPARNVTKDYPPTLLVHGTADTDVPFEQSARMDQELTRAGVEHRLISLPHAGHDLAGGDPRQIAEAYDAALKFVERHAGAD